MKEDASIISTVSIQINNGVLSGRIPGYPKDESTYHQGVLLSDFQTVNTFYILKYHECIIDLQDREKNQLIIRGDRNFDNLEKDTCFNRTVSGIDPNHSENTFPSYAKLFLITKYESFFYTQHFYKINTEFAYEKNGNIRRVDVSVEYAISWPWSKNEPSKFVKYEILEEYPNSPEYIRGKYIHTNQINYQCSFLDKLIKKIVTPGSDGSRYTVDYDKLQDLFAESVIFDDHGMPSFKNKVQEVEKDESKQEITHNNNNDVVTSVVDPSIYESTLAGDIEDFVIACTIA